MTSLWKAEPTLILSAVSAAIALLLAFGVPVSKEQMGAIMAFVAAVLGLINRSQVTSPATLQSMTPKTLADAQDTAQPVKDVVKKLPAVLLACALAGSLACTTTRHVAVVADATFAQAVFAIDDAEFQACQSGLLTPDVCAAANPKIKQALLDVRAVTAALQASPTGALPKTLPSLIGNLTEVQAMLAPLAPSLVKQDLVEKIQFALRLAVAVLNSVAGAH